MDLNSLWNSNMKKYTDYTEHNKNLPKPTNYPEGHVETVEEFLARGGKITKAPRLKAPGEMAGDAPRRKLGTHGMYDCDYYEEE